MFWAEGSPVRRTGGKVMFSATDLTKHLGCTHSTHLELLRLAGDLPVPKGEDAGLDLLARLGNRHEDAYLESLMAKGLTVVRIETAFGVEERRLAAAQTVAAIRSGADVVYQAVLDDGDFGGQADFLLKVKRKSDLGAWSYDVADTKLARRLKVAALLQMTVYAEALGHLQGAPPEWLYVVTGDGESRPWRYADVASYARSARTRFVEFVADRPDTEAIPVEQCGQCRWATRCDTEWQEADDLSLVANMTRGQREKFREAEIRTVQSLAGTAVADLPRAVGEAARHRLAAQAALQVQERDTGVPAFVLLDAHQDRDGILLPKGLLRLPEPDKGDVYLDFEGDPYAEDGVGREYLVVRLRIDLAGRCRRLLVVPVTTALALPLSATRRAESKHRQPAPPFHRWTTSWHRLRGRHRLPSPLGAQPRRRGGARGRADPAADGTGRRVPGHARLPLRPV